HTSSQAALESQRPVMHHWGREVFLNPPDIDTRPDETTLRTNLILDARRRSESDRAVVTWCIRKVSQRRSGIEYAHARICIWGRFGADGVKVGQAPNFIAEQAISPV